MTSERTLIGARKSGHTTNFWLTTWRRGRPKLSCILPGDTFRSCDEQESDFNAQKSCPQETSAQESEGGSRPATGIASDDCRAPARWNQRTRLSPCSVVYR